MCDLTQSIDIIDRLLSVLGDRKNFQKIYSEALGGSVSGDISMIRSDLFNKPNYLGALLFEDTASVLLLLQQTGLVHYENLTGTLSEREQLQETELWSPGYNDKEDCIIKFLDYTNNHHADSMRIPFPTCHKGDADADWVEECPEYDEEEGET